MDIRPALLSSLLALGTVAHAEGFYVLGSVGAGNTGMRDWSQSEIDGWVGTAHGSAVSSSKIDDTDTVYKLQLGYQFTENFALEGGYMDLGEAEYSATLNNGSTTKLSYDSDGWNINGVLTLPVNAGASLLGKVGVMRVETDYSVPYWSYGNSETKTTPLFGIGLAWNFWQNVSARVEWEHVFDFGEDDNNLDIDLYTAGLSYQF